MTEQEWLQESKPRALIAHLAHQQHDRKLRLFALACCRRVQIFLKDDRSKRAIDVAERFADGLSDEAVLWSAWKDARAAVDAVESRCPRDEGGSIISTPESSAACAVLRAVSVPDLGFVSFTSASRDAAFYATGPFYDLEFERTKSSEYATAASLQEEATQCQLLRDIFGNPFRPVTLVSTWLSPTVIQLARSAYDGGSFDCLPILADALEEAACTDEDILEHCRDPGPHVRGCWAVDLLLGKS